MNGAYSNLQLKTANRAKYTSSLSDKQNTETMNEILITPGVYTLPNNCKAMVRNGKVLVSIKKSYHSAPRCRECVHCIMAYSKYGQVNKSPVCDLQPKSNRGYTKPEIMRQRRYYVVNPYSTACMKFEPKTTGI